MRILDGNLRLITPVEGPDCEPTDVAAASGDTGRYYQLSHDYLVPSLRQWLTQKQKETWRGRAALCLGERSAEWQVQKRRRYLPSALEYVQISLGVPRSQRTPDQREMMGAAGRHHQVRALCMACVVIAVGAGAALWQAESNAVRADELIGNLGQAEIDQVPAIIKDLQAYGSIAEPKLRQLREDAQATSKQRLHASLALVRHDAKQIPFLTEQLLTATPQQLVVIRLALADHRAEATARLWEVLSDVNANGSKRLPAAGALATLDTNNPQWPAIGEQVARELVLQDAHLLDQWIAVFRPVKIHLTAPLKKLFAQRQNVDQSSAAALALASYLSANMDELFELYEHAEDRQVAPLQAALANHRAKALPRLRATLAGDMGNLQKQLAKEEAVKKIVGAALALLLFGEDRGVWPLLQRREDPHIRAQLIHRISRNGIDPRLLIDRLAKDQDSGIRAALIMGLGGFESNQIGPKGLANLADQLVAIYKQDPDPEVHSAARWYLRARGFADRIPPADRLLIQIGLQGSPRWWLTSECHTMVAIKGPAALTLQWSDEENANPDAKKPSPIRVSQSFAISTGEVTVEQFQHFKPQYHPDPAINPDPDCPVTNVTLNEMAEYCNWLSEQVRIPPDEWCYEWKTDPNGKKSKELWPRTDFSTKRGFRLPLENEWEFASQADMVTKRFYGETDELMSDYVWHHGNANDRTMPGGLLRPNPNGLFDIYGNAVELCELTSIADSVTRRVSVMRGGSYFERFPAGYRVQVIPNPSSNAGFRIVQSLNRKLPASRLLQPPKS